jgi:hypothetical protein
MSGSGISIRAIIPTDLSFQGVLEGFTRMPCISSTESLLDGINRHSEQVAIAILQSPPSQAPVSSVGSQKSASADATPRAAPPPSSDTEPTPGEPVQAKVEKVPLGVYTKGQGFHGVSTAIIGACATRGLLTYILMPHLSKASLYGNGIIGLGKCVIAILKTAQQDQYTNAQNMLEEGLFHLVTAAYDYAVARFSTIRTLFSLLYAVAPSEGLRLHGKFYIPFTAAVCQQTDASEKSMASVRKKYCWIQVAADIIQEACLPSSSGAANYFSNLIAAFKKRVDSQSPS